MAGAGEGRAVLISNTRLAHRSGTEVVTVDYALGLAARGWRVTVHSGELGEIAGTLAGRAAVVDRLGADVETPDLIQGHQHPGLAACMARFPATPALHLCHDALDWKDAALRLPRVRAHAAVDLACQERFARELGRDPATIPLLPNAIDLDRCRPRSSLPARPRRVLIVANRHGDHVAAVQQACDRHALTHRTVGYGVFSPALALEHEMAEADIVVGAARIALEAMAVGCAVLVCDARGLAGMATSRNYDTWAAWNFGFRLLTRPLDPAAITEALAGYDAQDAAAVSARVRAERGLPAALDRLEAVYAAVLAGDATPAPRDEAVAWADYLQRWLPYGLDSSPFAGEVAAIREDARRANVKLDLLTGELRRRGMNVTFREEPGPT